MAPGAMWSRPPADGRQTPSRRSAWSWEVVVSSVLRWRHREWWSNCSTRRVDEVVVPELCVDVGPVTPW